MLITTTANHHSLTVMQSLHPYNGCPLEIRGNVYGYGGDTCWMLLECRPNGPALIAESFDKSELAELMADLQGS